MEIRNTSHGQRVQMIELHEAGISLPQIAQQLDLSRFTVRKWWRRYRTHGWAGLEPQPCGPEPTGALTKYDPRVKYVALRLKCEHPGWGPDLLLLELSRRRSLAGLALPKRTALYNYLRPFLPRLNDSGRVRTKRPNPEVEPTEQVHQRWQMDFKGNVRLSDGSQVAPWLACDEHSSAPLAAQLYAARRGDPRQGLTFRDIQANLRTVFSQWGCPQQLRMDRDPLWVGSTRLEWPGTLLLWLVGLAIQPIVNPPGKPTDNAQVERLNRTWDQHVYRGQESLTPAALQQATDQAWQDRRQVLPSNNRHCQRRPPSVAFPELLTTERPFHPDQETKLFEMDRVYAYLSEWKWERKVDASGSISVADFNRRISLDHYRQIVKVRFDLKERVFCAAAVDETRLATFTLPVIAPDYILGVRNR